MEGKSGLQRTMGEAEVGLEACLELTSLQNDPEKQFVIDWVVPEVV